MFGLHSLARPTRVAVVRNTDGTTSVKIAMTATPDTTYHFYLKCVRQLGDIKTDDEGIGEAFRPIRPAPFLRSTCTPKARLLGTSTKACRSIFSRRQALAASASCAKTENTSGLRSRL
jgi:hypothetical protein